MSSRETYDELIALLRRENKALATLTAREVREAQLITTYAELLRWSAIEGHITPLSKVEPR